MSSAAHNSSTRLLTVKQWTETHAWPPLGGLRHLIFFAKSNGFDAVVRRVGRRILLDERRSSNSCKSRGDAMLAANHNPTDVLSSAEIVSAQNLAGHSRFASQYALARLMSELSGREIYLVTWPIGIAAMVDAEPGTIEWDQLLLASYAAAIDGQFNPHSGV